MRSCICPYICCFFPHGISQIRMLRPQLAFSPFVVENKSKWYMFDPRCSGTAHQSSEDLNAPITAVEPQPISVEHHALKGFT